nr:hypothetical protein [Tanacetum cinerariifolium]
MIVELDRDEGIELMGEKEEKKKDIADDDQVEGRHAEIQDEKQAEIYQIDMGSCCKVLSIANIVAIPAATITAALVISKDKGKAIMVEEPKPMKKKDQVELDAEYARKLHDELNKEIDWDTSIDHMKQKAKEDKTVQRYQGIKKRPQTEAQARKNMITYLRNTAGFRLDNFKGLSYDDIRPIFEAKFNTNMEFLLNSKEQLEEEDKRAIESINETPSQKAAKRRKLNEEAKDIKDLKQYLEIMPNDDDDVYTKDNVWKTRWIRQCMEESKEYPLLKFTLEQMLNVVRLQVEEQTPSSSSSSLTTITTETPTTLKLLLAVTLGRAIFNIKSTSFQDALTTTTTTTTIDQIARQLSDATSSVTQYLSTTVVLKKLSTTTAPKIPMQNRLHNVNTNMIINEHQEQPHARTRSHKPNRAISDAVEYHHRQPPHKTRTPPLCVSSSHMSTHE